jgi:hypothetical protein
VEDGVIKSAKAPPPWFKRFLPGLKHGEIQLVYEDGFPVLRAEEKIPAPRGDEVIRIYASREEDGVLSVFGQYGLLLREDVLPVAICRGLRFAARRVEHSERAIFFLGCRVYEECDFVIDIPLRDFSPSESVNFVLRTKSGDLPVSVCLKTNEGEPGKRI